MSTNGPRLQALLLLVAEPDGEVALQHVEGVGVVVVNVGIGLPGAWGLGEDEIVARALDAHAPADVLALAGAEQYGCVAHSDFIARRRSSSSSEGSSSAKEPFGISPARA